MVMFSVKSCSRSCVSFVELLVFRVVHSFNTCRVRAIFHLAKPKKDFLLKHLQYYQNVMLISSFFFTCEVKFSEFTAGVKYRHEKWVVQPVLRVT